MSILKTINWSIWILCAVLLAVLLWWLSDLYPQVATLQKQANAFADIKMPLNSTGTKFYANDYDPKTKSGTLLHTLRAENRDYVPLEKIPKSLVLLVLAAEDHTFYQHKGINFTALARAGIADVVAGSPKQGASTITMQLARNIYLPHQMHIKKIERKLTEILFARALEDKYTKDEILEAYLNQMFFGAYSYGIKAAARTYFNKDLEELTLAEMAWLAGLLQRPSGYNPFRDDPKLAKEAEKASVARRDRVLSQLKRIRDLNRPEDTEFISKMKRISDSQIANAQKAKLNLSKGKSSFRGPEFAPYFVNYARDYLLDSRGEDELLRTGLVVVTTLDPKLQRAADEIVVKTVSGLRRRRVEQGGLVCVENGTSFVRAMVGGINYRQSQFNRAAQAIRQPGSSMKPYLYAAALEDGMDLDTPVHDSPKAYKMGGGKYWSPRNSGGGYMGTMPLAYALVRSRNAASVDIISRIGPQKVIDLARKMGITTRLDPVLSLALGANGLRMVEHCAAFTTFPNQGIFVEPTPILKIYDGSGNLILDNTKSKPYGKQVISKETAAKMVVTMQGVITSGTGTRARIGRPAGGKTGTTNNNRDAWFVGFTADYTTACWVGNDKWVSMSRMFGGEAPATMWRSFMTKAHEGKPAKDFNYGIPKPKLPGFYATGEAKEEEILEEIEVKPTDPIKPIDEMVPPDGGGKTEPPQEEKPKQNPDEIPSHPPQEEPPKEDNGGGKGDQSNENKKPPGDSGDGSVFF